MDIKESKELSFDTQDFPKEVWVFDADNLDQGTEISHLMMSHAEQYIKDELLEICRQASMVIDQLRAELAKAQAVPEVAQRQGGYYIRDLRSQPGNCMKFWYQAGYGTKHKNFFWCATLEEAKEYKGGCDWFEIWHAPYIDSLVEYTVDFQLADRGVGLVDLKAQEPVND